jgi:pimeloyl-ACP methyl ester carboxylesterase
VARHANPTPPSRELLSDAELRGIAAPVLMIWGDADPYGGPEIGRRAAAIMRDAQIEVIPGRHAPFLDDPERCGELIGSWSTGWSTTHR